MNGKPYLDKICANPHYASQYQDITEEEVVVIPPLKHTGIQSELSKDIIPITNPEGRITPHYKFHSKTSLQPIYRDKKGFENREHVFKQGHKQFIDKVLLDMETQKRDKHERRMKHWKSNKDTLGFSNQFTLKNSSSDFNNFTLPNNNSNNNIDSPILSPINRPTTNSMNNNRQDMMNNHEFKQSRPTSPSAHSIHSYSQQQQSPHHQPPPLSPSMSINHPPLRTASSVSGNRSIHSLNSSSSSNNDNSMLSSPSHRMRPFSRMSLFKELLETTEPPKSPNKKRFGSMMDVSMAIADAQRTMSRLDGPGDR
jgi:hypothetical protein